MIHRFASASAVASVVIAVAAVILRLVPVPTLESRFLVTSIWCMLPLVWGVWATLTPQSWLPRRLPQWGAILGLIAGLMVVFVLDLPGQIRGESLPIWLRGIGVVLAIGIYFLLWMLVQRTYRTLTADTVARVLR